MARKRKPNPISANRNLSHSEIADIIGISETAMRGYATRGCPRNPDGGYDSSVVIEWMEDQARSGNGAETGVLETLQARRIERNIELTDIVIATKRGETISLADHDAVLGAQASEMRAFLTGSLPANAEHFVGKPVEEVRVLLLELARQAVEVWIAAPVKVVQSDARG